MNRNDPRSAAAHRDRERKMKLWRERCDAAVAGFLHFTGARRASMPTALLSDERYSVAYHLIDHAFCGRTRNGLFIVSELWCTAWQDGSYLSVARELVKVGFKVSSLPTLFSTRAMGLRQPTILIPPGSDVNPHDIYAALVAANFKGAPAYEPP